jgi:peptidoglycan/xylan/chitin deacetylase (PgdA/CDA1 family)
MLSLLYHNIVERPVANVPVASSQVTARTFRQHLERFRSRLLDPFDVHHQLINGNTPRGVLITFDDGATGIVEAGRILAEMGARGVAFICPGALPSGLWFYRLADALMRSSVSRIRWRDSFLDNSSRMDKLKTYKAISSVLFDLAESERDSCLQSIIADLRPTAQPMLPSLTTLNEDGLREAERTGGLVFANHSWSHPNLATLPEGELRREIEQAHSWLLSSGLPTVPWFAFPRGTYNSDVVSEVARCCPVAFGANAIESHELVWPRTYVCELDSNRVRLAAKTALEGRLRRTLSSFI